MAEVANDTPQEADQWDVVVQEDTGKSWSEMNGGEKALTVVMGFMKLVAVCFFLYLFIVSLSIMGSAFKVIAGPTAGEVFRNNEIFDNPIAGLVLGVLATVLVQSSSTSTSIIITMTASDLMEIKNAIPMIMGANIGTSVTNTIVSVFQMGDKNQYRRAFGGATVHDCFNILTVMVLLPIEAATGLLRHIGEGIVGDKDFEKGEKQDFLKKITKPFTERVAQVDKKLVEKVAKETDQEALDKLLETSMFKNKVDTTNNLFLDTPMSDTVAGFVMLIVSLLVLSTCLILLVKVLQSVFKGKFAIALKWLLNLEFKAVPFVADYILIVFGMIITILMQSSSVTTSTLTPLVGIGMVRLEKMFCFTVGANIGTTCTGIISALASSNINTGLKVALAHLFFNLIGTALWFPVPLIRSIPINMAKGLGCIAADWKWFPIAYIATMFGVLPGLLLVLSLIHWAVVIVFLLFFLPVAIGGLVVLSMRSRSPQRLPQWALKDPVIAGRSILPPCLMMNPPAEEESSAQQASAEEKNEWHIEPFVWGPKWFVISALFLAVFNAKWADIKYAPRHDNRDHFGIGSYKTCSLAFEDDASWAQMPGSAADCADYLATCAASVDVPAPSADDDERALPFSSCTSADEWGGNFANVDGHDEYYWEFMFACTQRCSLADWETVCSNLGCRGSKHVEQCKNVSESAARDYNLQYVSSASVPWSAGDKCREPSALCNNDGDIANCGNLAVASMVILFISIMLMFFRGLAGKAQERNILAACAAVDGLAWLLLLASWALFASKRGADTECIVAVPGNHGFAMADGTFDEIINTGGGYTFYITLFSWIIMSFVTGAIVDRVVRYNANSGKSVS